MDKRKGGEGRAERGIGGGWYPNLFLHSWGRDQGGATWRNRRRLGQRHGPNLSRGERCPIYGRLRRGGSWQRLGRGPWVWRCV